MHAKNWENDKCHPSMMEWCEKCGHWAGPDPIRPEDLEAYKSELITFDQLADSVCDLIDRQTLRLLVAGGYVPSASYAPNHFKPGLVVQLQERLKQPEVVERLKEWKDWKMLFRRGRDPHK